MRVLIITKIYPNAREPLSSPFNRQQFAALARRCEVEVLATIPWFPGRRRLADVPRHEVIDGLPVGHPRFLYVPRLPALTGPLYAASLLPAVLRRRGRFDVVLGSWAYPDGCAAIALARALGVPAVVKLHGSDMNVVATLRGPRAHLRFALPRAARVVAVSRALADAAAALGVARDRIDVVQNGVDATLFHLRPRAAARAALGHGGDDRTWLLYVGRLEHSKGIGDLLAAFETLAPTRPRLALALVGDGGARAECDALAARLGSDRVIVAGARPLAEVPAWMAACDVLTLPSWNEGTPNVILEALACGRRVVATRVGGIPDLIDRPALGELVAAKDPLALAGALGRAADLPYDPAAVAATGARGGWDESAGHLHDTLQRAVG